MSFCSDDMAVQVSKDEMDILFLPLPKFFCVTRKNSTILSLFLEVVLQVNISESNTEQKIFYCHYLFISCMHGNPAVNISPVVTVF